MNPLRRIVGEVCSDEIRGTTDEKHLEETLYLSLLGAGNTSPNPMVSAKVVKNNETLGVGIHRFFGKEHAEVLALSIAKERAEGAEVYVNLEPCTHFGNQPPCTSALIEAKVKRVVFASYDPNPLTCRRAMKILLDAQVQVNGPLLPFATARLNDAYFYRHLKKGVFVVLKLAASIDGKIALSNKDSKWISGKISRGYAHYLRLVHDAVLVGVGTVLADNPRLTVRKAILSEFLQEDTPRVIIRHPARVIIDPNFSVLQDEDLPKKIEALSSQQEDEITELERIPASDNPIEEKSRFSESALTLPPLNIFKKSLPIRENLPWLIFIGAEKSKPQVRNLPSGVEIIQLESKNDTLNYEKAWNSLEKLGISSVLVEGGAGVASNLLKQKACQRLDLVLAPMFLGSNGIGYSPKLELEKIENAPRLSYTLSVPLGRDYLISGYLDDFITPFAKSK